ncbi:aldo/keto reductase, partial [Onishia niordana]|uniref:aldo/keto reductase n=1 Tax=Onishia niordana TaxID=2508711 RepID=UPI00197AE425
IETAYENGINFFDHADIYGAGQCETVFAEALAQTSIRREDIYLQSKCAIRPGVSFYFSKEHIIKSGAVSLQRLPTDYLDTMLFH